MKQKKIKSAPWWKVHSGIVIVAAIAIIALAFLAIFRFPAVGQATGLVRVCGDVTEEYNRLDLNSNNRLQLDVTQVESCLLFFRSSEANAHSEYYVLTLTTNRDGTVKYDLETQNRDEKIALGLLGSQLSDTRGILVNKEDTLPDVEFHYANGLFEVVNLLAVAPVYSEFRIHLSSYLAGNYVNLEKPIFTALAQVPVTYSLFISAPPDRAITPQLKIDNQIVATVNASSLVLYTPPNSQIPINNQFRFTWAPTSVGLHNFTIIAEIQNDTKNVSIQKSYDVAIDGIIYQLSSDANYPQTTLTLKNEQTREAQVTYIFQNITEKQPFSVPCTAATPLESIQLVPATPPGGVPATTSNTAGVLLEVFGYDAQRQQIQGWRRNAPSEFAQLIPQRGYSLNLKDVSTPWMFTLTCILPEQPELPSLVRGWNLVSITGYKAVPVTELTAKKAPPGTTITHAKELLRNDVPSSAEVTSLMPGKAYWVFIQ